MFQPQAHLEKRILVNYSVDPSVLQLPAGFQPRLVDGRAVTGLCLLHLSALQPSPYVPALPDYKTWGIAYRVGVIDPQGENAVYISKRLTNSWLQSNVGSLVFPGVHEKVRVEEEERLGSIEVKMLGGINEHLHLKVELGKEEWASKLFPTVEDASAFFQAPVGYSPGKTGALEGMKMEVTPWGVTPVDLAVATSSYINSFPEGTIEYDHTLLMQHADVRWSAVKV